MNAVLLRKGRSRQLALDFGSDAQEGNTVPDVGGASFGPKRLETKAIPTCGTTLHATRERELGGTAALRLRVAC